jgi:hypothetical protein
MIIKLTKEITLDCYVDTDFVRLFLTSDPDDPKSVKSRSGLSSRWGRFQCPGAASYNPRRPYPQWKPSISPCLKPFALSSLFELFLMKFLRSSPSQARPSLCYKIYHLRGQSGMHFSCHLRSTQTDASLQEYCCEIPLGSRASRTRCHRNSSPRVCRSVGQYFYKTAHAGNFTISKQTATWLVNSSSSPVSSFISKTESDTRHLLDIFPTMFSTILSS